MTGIPQIVQGLVIRPGDKLLLVFNDHQTMAAMDEIRTAIEECLPGVQAVIFEGVQQLAVYRPGPAVRVPHIDLPDDPDGT